jgi:hypothetical protein
MRQNQGPPDGAHTHLIDFPEALEVLFTRMDELKVVLGPAAAPEVDAVAATLRAGLAARQRGDVADGVGRIADAMERLAALAGRGDPAEGEAMRALAARFRQALGRGSVSEARAAADVMRARSGSVLHSRKDR